MWESAGCIHTPCCSLARVRASAAYLAESKKSPGCAAKELFFMGSMGSAGSGMKGKPSRETGKPSSTEMALSDSRRREKRTKPDKVA